MVKITTKQQFEFLIARMEANPNVARGVRLFGQTKATTDEVWKAIAEELNSYGPPTRTPDEWQRVWIHFKAKLKKKMSQNKRNHNITGGGPSQEVSLSALEQAAADLLQIDLSVNPEGALFGVIPATLNVEEVLEIEPNTDKDQENVVQQVDMGNECLNPRKRVRTEDKKVGLLKEQTATQSELLSTIKKIEKHLYKQNEIMKDIKDLKRKKYEIFKEMKEMKKKKYEAQAEEHKLNGEIKRIKLKLLQEQLQSLHNANM